MNRKLLSSALLVILIGGFTLAHMSFFIVQAATNVTGIIYSDITWTKANSPYTLTGPVAVNIGVTLTIEPGATVDFNGYYIQVNGTLIAVGSSSNWIQFNGGELVFKPVSTGWDEQTDSGSQFEYANFSSATVSSSVPLKVSHCQSDGEMSMGGSSLVSDSLILNKITIAGSCRVLRNSITSGGGGVEVTSNVASVISDNTITAGDTYSAVKIAGGSTVISNNQLSGGGTFYNYIIDPRNPVTVYALIVNSGVAEISNNNIIGGVLVGNSSSIVENTISERGILISDGSPVVSNNSIEGGIAIGRSRNSGVGSPKILCNKVKAIRIYDGSVQISGNTVVGYGLSDGIVFDHEYEEDTSVVSDNWVSNCCYGLGFWGASGTAIFERNSVKNSVYGMSLSGGTLIIQNNTLFNSTFGIYLAKFAIVQSIIYNNIQDSEQGNLLLEGSPNDVNATYNWWGTTDRGEISQSIHDFDDDFNLGKVTFVPFLTEPNSKAEPDPNALPTLTPSPTPLLSPSPSPTPATSPTLTPTPTPTQEPLQTEFTTIIGIALIAVVLGAGLGLLVYLIKRK